MLLGLLGCVFALPAWACVFLLLQGGAEAALQCWGLLLCVDGVLQLPALLCGPCAGYPAAPAGLALAQACLALFFLASSWAPRLADLLFRNCSLLLRCGLALSLHHLARALACPPLAALAALAALLLVPPSLLLRLCDAYAHTVHPLLVALCAHLQGLCERLQRLLLRLLEQPLIQALLQRAQALAHSLLLPLARALSPWPLPLACTALALLWLLPAPALLWGLPAPAPPALQAALLLRCLAGALTAATCACTLAWQAATLTAPQRCLLQDPPPLRSPAAARAMHALCSALGLPSRLLFQHLQHLQRLLALLLNHALLPLWDAMLSLAQARPGVALPLFILAFALLYAALFASGCVDAVVGPVSAALAQLLAHLQALQHVSLCQLHAQPLLLEAMTVAQMRALDLMARALRPACSAAPPTDESPLPAHTLDTLAQGMAQPLQCLSCGCGPIDFGGCASLATHHGQGGVSNACPSCGWFSRCRGDWVPYSLRSAHARSVYLRRVWGEGVGAVRASAKGSCAPLLLLLLAGGSAGLPHWLVTALGAAYLGAWLWVEQGREVNLGRPFREEAVAARAAAPAPTAAAAGSDDAPRCGAQAQAQRAPPSISAVEAMEDVRCGRPAHVFLAAGDACPVCLEEFEAAAVEAAGAGAGAGGGNAALQALAPACVALRCGHPLHLSCATDTARAEARHRIRCPLCREHATVRGMVLASLFS